MSLRWGYRDLAVGQIISHARGKTLTEAESAMLCTMAMNTAEAHFNRDVAAPGHPVVFGGISLALVAGLASDVWIDCFVRERGLTDVRFLHPVHPGDTLYARSEIRRLVPVEGGRIVTLGLTGINQNGTEVLRAQREIHLAA